MKKQRMTRAIYAIGLVLALLATTWAMAACQAEEPEARYNTLVYTEQGGAKLVVESGGELEVQSGGTIDIQSGATVDMSGGIDLDGSEMIIDADGNTSLTADTDNQIDLRIEANDEFVFTADQLDVTNGQIVNIGAAGTDFGATGGLSLAAPLFLSDGTNTAPAIATTTDVNTGFYRAAADNLGLSINGTLDFDWAANDMDFNTSIASNIGNSGTDFNSSGGLTLAAPLLFSNGAVGAPALANTTDTNTGIYMVGTDNPGISINGALDFDFAANDMDFNTSIATNIGNANTDFDSSGGLTLAAPLFLSDGSNTAPAIATTSDVNTGFYRISEDLLGLSVNGTLDFSWGVNDMDMQTSIISNIGAAGTDFGTSGELTLAAPLVNAAGTYTLPQITWTGDTNAGFYHVAADNIGVSLNGALDFDFGANDLDFNTSVATNIGSADTDFSASGGLSLAAPLVNAAGTYTLPQITWTDDTDMGFYRVSADLIGVSLAGALDFQFGANTFTALAGSSIAADTIAETTGANGVAIDGWTIKDGGPVIQNQAKTSNYDVLVTDNGDVFTNVGASAEVTFTLPSAVAGLNYCFYVYEAYTITLELDGSDIIYDLTNAAGDRLQNTGTAGDNVCLIAIDVTNWIALPAEHGTWSDIS